MKYYSTNGKAPIADLRKAVVKGLAEDRGLYMPERIKKLPKEFFDTIETKSFQEIAYTVADAFFGEDVEADALKKIVYDTLSFDCPVVKVKDNIYTLELFHGPTLAFKDVGARFMARLLQYFTSDSRGTSSSRDTSKPSINVLVATSGDTGSAVANGFLGVEGIHVYVLYPKGKVSKIQESQFTTLGKNITAVEVDGVFDDCQALVKSAFMDEELNHHMKLTSANSINVARFLPQAFYYFNAYARMKETLNPPLSTLNSLSVCPVVTSAISALPCSDTRWDCLSSGSLLPIMPTTSSINTCRQGSTSRKLPCRLLPMRWMWVIPPTSHVSTTSMARAMSESAVLSAVPRIVTNKSVRPCVSVMRKQAISSTPMAHVAIVPCRRD